jgi:palmitoyltransferase ZDHHC9/14/18
MSQPSNLNDGESVDAQQMAPANSTGRIGRQLSDDGEVQQPPSPGTEMTGQETLDRITANTSPTPGHNPQGSLTESMRPLQKKVGMGEHRGLQVHTDKSYMERPNNPSPLKSPRSFRSSFLLPGKDNAQNKNGSNRNLDGAEKLSSGASSPQLERMEVPAKSPPKASTRLGRVYQYFEGNTVFCLGGRWQNTRSKPVNVATGLCVLVPGALYFIFSAPWLWENISPSIPIVFAYVFYICFSSFVHASVSDPGVSAAIFGPQALPC